MARAPKHQSFSRAALGSRWSRLARAAVDKYYSDLLGLRAAALSYWTLVSVVPLLAVAFSVLKAFGVETLIERFLSEALEPLGAGRAAFTEQIVGFVSNAQVAVLGAAGVVGLFYTAISLIGSVEEALNQIWRAQPVRAWTRRYGEYLGFLLVAPVFLFVVLALLATAHSTWLVQRLIEMRVIGSVFALLARVVPFLILWLGFTVLYKIIPSADVRLRSAVFGAAIAAILWHLAGLAFAAFVADSRNYTALYSGFAIAIVFFLWLNLAWLIVLLGGTMAYLHQHAHLYLRGEAKENASLATLEWIALRVLSEITRAHASGRPPMSEAELSDRLAAPQAQIDLVIDKLVGGGLLLRAAEPPGIGLARAPENVSAVEILDAMRGELAPPNGSDPMTELLRRRDLALRHGLEGITLKSLSEAPEVGPPNEIDMPREKE
jgi:membrane protein